MQVEISFVEEHRKKLLKKIIGILLLILVMMMPVRFFQHASAQLFVDLLFFLVLLYGYRGLANDSISYKGLSRALVFFGLMATFHLLLNVHREHMYIVWFSTIIYFIFYFFSTRESLLWSFLTGAGLYLVYLYDPSALQMSFREYLVWGSNVLIVVLLIYWYQGIVDTFLKRLLDAQEQLGSEVESKTEELRTINENLEKRISEELQKVHDQNQIIITQSRQAQMGEMLSMIAHQWRQPLTAISATSSLIELKATVGQLDQKSLIRQAQDISRNVQYLSTTIDDFRNFFKPNKELRKIDYDMLIDAVLGIIQASLTDKNITVHRKLSCHASFYGYPNELKQVLLNLIKNAEDALIENESREPFVRIETRREGPHCILEISDNGGGIPDEIIGEIFDPYFSTKDKKIGTGLGLYMSKTIIEDHCRGNLSVINAGDGALFRIVLEIVE